MVQIPISRYLFQFSGEEILDMGGRFLFWAAVEVRRLA